MQVFSEPVHYSCPLYVLKGIIYNAFSKVVFSKRIFLKTNTGVVDDVIATGTLRKLPGKFMGAFLVVIKGFFNVLFPT